MAQIEPVGAPSAAFSGWRSEFALGFVYWLAFVLVLEPGNILQAIHDGGALPLGQEIVRLLGAGLLGAAMTPAVFALMRRFPVEGKARFRHLAVHFAGDAAIAFALIVIAGILASLILTEDRRPLLAALRGQLAVDGLLLFFCVAALDGLAHAIHFLRQSEALRGAMRETAAPGGWLTTVPVKSRGRTAMLDMDSVDWIETQGNYLALHVDAAVHLIRETSTRFEARLDPGRFARIHRQTIVAIGRIKEMAPLANGDATVWLEDGTELRLSRNFREAVRAKFEARGA